jgi:hypothetical protein
MMRTRCSISPFIADDTKHEVEETMLIHSVVSRGFRECDLGLPSYFLLPKQLQNNSMELSDKPRTKYILQIYVLKISCIEVIECLFFRHAFLIFASKEVTTVYIPY